MTRRILRCQLEDMVSRIGRYLQLAYRINSRVESTTGSSSICDLGKWPKEIRIGSIYRFFKMASNVMLLEEKTVEPSVQNAIKFHCSFFALI